MYAVDVLCHHHAAHHIKHLQFSVAADDDVVAALVGEDAVCLDLGEYQSEPVIAVGNRAHECVMIIGIQINYSVFQFIDELDSYTFSVFEIESNGVTASLPCLEVQRKFTCHFRGRNSVILAILRDVQFSMTLVEYELLELAAFVEAHNCFILEGVAADTCFCKCHLEVAVVA